MNQSKAIAAFRALVESGVPEVTIRAAKPVATLPPGAGPGTDSGVEQPDKPHEYEVYAADPTPGGVTDKVMGIAHEHGLSLGSSDVLLR